MGKLVYPGIHGKKKYRRVYALAKSRMTREQSPTKQKMKSEQEKRRKKQMPHRRQCIHSAASATRGNSARFNALFDIRSEKGRIIHGWHEGVNPSCSSARVARPLWKREWQ